MYAIIPQQIPQDKRAEVNEKILFAINSGKDLIPAESIYNCYTGVGGLHNLRQSDFASYHEYARAKKEFELGQFFTPHEICREMVDVLSPTSSEMVLDMCCGMGNFFNHLPNRHNTYGFDIDGKAVAVARYLYPDAHIEKCDIQQYRPEQRFDIIIGNPPFNLKFDFRLSQEYYMDKAYDLLNPAGILMIVVPSSFMQSEFWEKRRITGINDKFSFVGQCGLAPHAFTSVGVDNFNTKVMVFLRHSRHIGMQPYNADEFVTMEELKERVMQARDMKHRLRFDLMRETNRIDKEELEQFEYKLSKYMYELKAHASLNRHIDKATALVTKFRNQKPPENATNEQVKEWERKKLTTAKVLAVIRKYITTQNVVPRKEIALVKTSYGFKLKAYAPRLLDKVEHKAAGINSLILERTALPEPEFLTEANIRQLQAARKFIARKQRQYDIQNREFPDMQPDHKLAEYLDNATFVNKDYETCQFTHLQKHDLNLVLQKRYALLNWQQGSGKTAAAYHRAKYLLKFRKVRNVVILAPAIAINMTWDAFLKTNKERYRVIRTSKDLEDVPEGIFLIVSTSMLGKLKRSLARFIKLRSRKLCLIFDESDEITNPNSQRTKYVLCLFRRLKYKLLDTNILIDGRIYDLAKTGFIEGTLVVPNFVLYELQYIADSGDSIKRVRGRRGLDILNKLRSEKIVPVEMYEGDFEDVQEVDSKLIKLAKMIDAVIVTNDYNLNKVSEFQNVQVLNVNALAKALKPRVIPGEKLNVMVIKNGTERQQGVAYLDDGTMIVVEDGRYYMNKTIEVEVTSALQTDAGRMIFAKPSHSKRGINEKTN